jgi:hypothetical protein
VTSSCPLPATRSGFIAWHCLQRLRDAAFHVLQRGPFFLDPLDPCPEGFILPVHRHSLRDGWLRFSSRSPPELLSSPLSSCHCLPCWSCRESGESPPGLLAFMDLPSR